MNGLLFVVLPSSRSLTRPVTIRDQTHVLDDLVPSSELLVFADAKTEELLRRGDVVCGATLENASAERQCYDCESCCRCMTLKRDVRVILVIPPVFDSLDKLAA